MKFDWYTAEYLAKHYLFPEKIETKEMKAYKLGAHVFRFTETVTTYKSRQTLK